jgi:hypothetical protein
MNYTEYQGWDEWAEKYKPIKNPFRHDQEEVMFETYGEELDFVRNRGNEYIWTWSQGDQCDIISAGYHFVNRLGYYITEVPWTNEHDYCLLSEEIECECYDDETCEGKPDCDKCEGYGLITKYVEPVK